jgi:hypothetical protein
MTQEMAALYPIKVSAWLPPAESTGASSVLEGVEVSLLGS